jgi:hypothetical protein
MAVAYEKSRRWVEISDGSLGTRDHQKVTAMVTGCS